MRDKAFPRGRHRRLVHDRRRPGLFLQQQTQRLEGRRRSCFARSARLARRKAGPSVLWLRDAPRDALVADLAPPEARGASMGLRQALDTVGAFLGPLLAIGLMALTANRFRVVFWVAVVPAFLAVALLVVGVLEPLRPTRGAPGFPLGFPNYDEAAASGPSGRRGLSGWAARGERPLVAQSARSSNRS
jgi:hypothetical protein